VHIGIVIPAFNAASWIGDAMVSVLAQTHRDWSLVVVDDGSTDGTGDVAAAFADPRVALIRQTNAGVSAARNRGTVELLDRSAAVLFLDADDWLAPDALSRLAATLEASPQAIAAVGRYAIEATRSVRRAPSGDLLQRLLVRNLFANGGHLLLRDEAVRRAGGFVTGIAYGEDWEFWTRIALQGPFAATPGRAPVLFVREHSGGACYRLAFDPSAFGPCTDAIFGNPALLAHFGAARLATIRRHTEAENQWIIGRELIRHSRGGEGTVWLRRSVRAHPTARRVALLACAGLLPLLPSGLRGMFRPYRLPDQTPECARQPCE
jgi:glycosyltransferase involved in cell wall biosynthesis